eukprot:gene5822-11745_t
MPLGTSTLISQERFSQLTTSVNRIRTSSFHSFASVSSSSSSSSGGNNSGNSVISNKSYSKYDVGYDFDSDANAVLNSIDGKISHLFESAFSFTKLELSRLLDGPTNTTSAQSQGISKLFPIGITKSSTDISNSNQNTLIQELRTALKTILDEIEALKTDCCIVEECYRKTSKDCAFNLRKGMNVLYRLQQYISALDGMKKEKNELIKEKNKLRHTNATKEKECRLLYQELAAKTSAVEELDKEVVRLRDLIEANAKVSVQARHLRGLSYANFNKKLRSQSMSPSLADDGDGIGNDEGSPGVANKTQIQSQIQSQTRLKDDLRLSLAFVDELQDEMTELRVENWKLKAQCMETLRPGNSGSHLRPHSHTRSLRDATLTSEDGSIQTQTALEQRLEEEQTLRLQAEERLLQAQLDFRKAESDWNQLSVQVEVEMETNRMKLLESVQTVEKLTKENTQLSTALEQVVTDRELARTLIIQSEAEQQLKSQRGGNML